MLRRLEIAVVLGAGLAGACQGPRLIGDEPETSSSSTAGPASTSGEPGTTTTTTGGDTTTGGTTASVDSTSSSSSTSSDGGDETMGFVFDVGGGMELAYDLPVPLDYDCEDLIEPFIGETELGAARGYHDVAFDDDGHIIGFDGNSLLAVTYDDMVSVFSPGVTGGVQGMDYLENGDLLYVNNFGELRRVTPAMQNSVVASGLSGAYGITVGPDQQAYVCRSSGIVRVDPATGIQAPWLSPPGGNTPRAMVFNLDSSGVYISTLTFGAFAPVYYVDVDMDLDPSGAPVVFATGVGQGYHDGLGIDACGNLYVPDYNTAGLYRVDPNGVVTTLYAEPVVPLSHYGHGVEWGSGIDGWNDHAIYLPQPYDGNTVNEIDLGVPSGSTVRTWR